MIGEHKIVVVLPAYNAAHTLKQTLPAEHPEIKILQSEIAELNVIDPKYKWVFKKSDIQSKSSNSPILGKELFGKVLVTINKGFISSCRFK